MPQAEDLPRRLVPDERTHNGMVPVLSCFAAMELSRNDFAAADVSLKRATDYADLMFMAGSLPQVEALRVSALTAQRRGDFPTATARYAAALVAIEKKGSGTIAHAHVRQAQADLFRETRGFSAAEEKYRRAIEIRTRLAPQTASEAESRHGLAATLKAVGRLAEAEQEFSAAAAALEAQMGRACLGGVIAFGVASRSAQGVHLDYTELLRRGPHRRGVSAVGALARSELYRWARRARHSIHGRRSPRARQESGGRRKRATTSCRQRSLASAQQRIRRRCPALSASSTCSGPFWTGSRRHCATAPRTARVRYPGPFPPSRLQRRWIRARFSFPMWSARRIRRCSSCVLRRAPAVSWCTSIRIPSGEEELRRQVEAFRSMIAWKRPIAEVAARGRALYDLLIKPR